MTRQPHLYAALGFASTHDALDAEALLGDMGVEVTPIPAPAGISARCGIALRIGLEDESRARGFLGSAGIEVAARTEIADI